MKRRVVGQFVLAVLVIFALALASCTAPATTPAADTSADAEAQAGEEEAPAAEAEAEEAAAEEDESQAVVNESTAAQSKELEAGITVTSDEDIATQRDQTNFGGEYRDTGTSDAVSFHPYLTTDTASGGYQGLVYDSGLLRLDENTLEYIPNMAESYTISEDGLTFTFKLRENIQWTDGTPLTAHDFKWSYDQATNPDNGFPYLSQLEFITSYEALDDYTLEIKIDEVYAPALGQMSGLITPLPRHVWQDLPWDDPEKNPEINSPSVTSGPYKLVEWKRDQYIIFEANPDWWYKGAPLRERIVVEIVPNQDVSYQMLKTGEADSGTITPENLEEARQLDNVTVYEWWPAAASWSYIGLNMREGSPTHDVNVRHAINYAIDKELITDEVMLGQARRLCGPYPPTSWVYNSEIPCYEYDVDKAIEAFEAAGYTYDADANVMQTPEGEPLQLKLLFGPNTSQTRELIAVTVQDFLGDIGVEVEVQGLEWASFLEALDAENPDWDMFIGGWRATIEPHIMYTIWAEESIPSLNSVAYINKDVEQLYQEGGATYDIEVRKEKYGEAQRIIAEEAPYVFLFYSKSWSGQNNRVQGIEPKTLGIGWNSQDWWLEESPE
jgi:peptide/nickel transport system substrate-binding protein